MAMFRKEEATAAGEEGGDELTLTPEIVASLPKGPHCPAFPGIRQYRGFWIPDGALLLLPRVHAAFEEHPADDILLASFPKTGSTWLKALAFATARRAAHSPLDGAGGHPLLAANSHDLVKFIDTLQFLEDDDVDVGGGGNTAPRLLSTHLPYSLLPRRARATAAGGGCRIVYITRDPKDTLVALWHFESHVQLEARLQPAAVPPTAAGGGGSFEEAFERYCRGQCGLGPQWEHAREYWEASRRRPGHVLCLRYEELLRDTAGSLGTMAEFMGCPFSAAEEEAGVPRAIAELCSLEKQRSVPANRTGAMVAKGLMRIENKSYFRKGVAGDWRNHMSPEMAARLDGVVAEALKGSGFTFGDIE